MQVKSHISTAALPPVFLPTTRKETRESSEWNSVNINWWAINIQGPFYVLLITMIVLHYHWVMTDGMPPSISWDIVRYTEVGSRHRTRLANTGMKYQAFWFLKAVSVAQKPQVRSYLGGHGGPRQNCASKVLFTRRLSSLSILASALKRIQASPMF